MEKQHPSTLAVQPSGHLPRVCTDENEVQKAFVERLSRQDLNPFRKPVLSVLGLRGSKVTLWI